MQHSAFTLKIPTGNYVYRKHSSSFSESKTLYAVIR